MSYRQNKGRERSGTHPQLDRFPCRYYNIRFFRLNSYAVESTAKTPLAARRGAGRPSPRHRRRDGRATARQLPARRAQRRAAQPRLSADSLGSGARELGPREPELPPAGRRSRPRAARRRAAGRRRVATAGSLDWLAERIVYEDARLLVLDKPAGLAVHGGSGVSLGCIEALRRLRPRAKDLELAHRLDRGTSGCLLRREAPQRVADAARAAARRAGRQALSRRSCKGRWPERPSEIDAPLVTRRVGGEARVKVGRVRQGGAQHVSRCSSGSARPRRCSRSRSTPAGRIRSACTRRTSGTPWPATSATVTTTSTTLSDGIRPAADVPACALARRSTGPRPARSSRVERAVAATSSRPC